MKPIQFIRLIESHKNQISIATKRIRCKGYTRILCKMLFSKDNFMKSRYRLTPINKLMQINDLFLSILSIIIMKIK